MVLTHTMKQASRGAIVALAILASATPAIAAEPDKCNLAALAKPIAAGQTLTGTLGEKYCQTVSSHWTDRARNDTLYKFTVGRTSVLELTVSGAGFMPSLRIFDASGTSQLDPDSAHPDFPAGDGTRIRAAFRPGTYYATVLHRGDAPPADSRFSLALSVIDSAVAADAGGPCGKATMRKGRKLQLDVPADAELAATDCVVNGGRFADNYYVDVPTRRTLEVSATSLDFEPVVLLRNAAGGLVSAEGKNPQPAHFRATVPAGRYLLQAYARKETLATGAYRISVSTVGTPSADASTLGATCSATPDPLRMEGRYVTVDAMLTPESCKGKDGLPYHRYAFTLAKPFLVSLTPSGSGEVEIAGPSGTIKPAVVPGRDSGRNNIEYRLGPGPHVLTVTASPKAMADGEYVHFRREMELRESYPGIKASHCAFYKGEEVVPGTPVRGKVDEDSCRIEAAEKKGATMYTLALTEPHSVTIELSPGAADPDLFVAVLPQGGSLTYMNPRSAFRKGSIDLPGGAHTVYVGGSAFGDYTMKVSAARKPEQLSGVVGSSGVPCNADDTEPLRENVPLVGEFNAKSCMSSEPGLALHAYWFSVSSGFADIELVPGKQDPELMLGVQLQGEEGWRTTNVERGKPFRLRVTDFPNGHHVLFVGGRKVGRYKLVVRNKPEAARQ